MRSEHRPSAEIASFCVGSRSSLEPATLMSSTAPSMDVGSPRARRSISGGLGTSLHPLAAKLTAARSSATAERDTVSPAFLAPDGIYTDASADRQFLVDCRGSSPGR